MELKDIKLTPLLDTLRLEKISDKVYFSEKYSNYVSNSRLGLLNPRQDGNPDKFFSGLKFTTSQALALGSAVHELVLQPDSFELSEDVGKPTAKLGVMADELYPIFVERDVTKDDVVKASDKVDYYKGKITKDRANDVISECSNYWTKRKERELDITQDREIIYLDNKSLEIVKSCVSALNSNKQVQNLLHPKGLLQDPISENEQAILLDVKAECPNGSEFILHLKSKLDNYTIDLETNTIVVNDIKTIGKIVSEIDNNIKKFHYSREFAMYIYLLKLCAEKFYGLVNPKISANYLVVSTIPNFFTKVRPVTYGEIREGFHEFRTLLKYVAYNIGYNNYSLDERPSKYQL
jgi:hypothetical protein|uniref:Exodeoxyribonuclease 8 n=1 Tax=Podoviridae sp. ct8Lf7 TaxID=2827723 RepID=A0A8S5RZR5_9CAUD|nr:MAG TPA: Exodeoxyribonuclease 8 [Podoviridae sp. ct8Lf7]